jgi:S-adenosyl-L-methionine hydrolase (adenosine-forming)
MVCRGDGLPRGFVDPGVGGARPPITLDGRWYVGPGNGLFELVERRATSKRSWDIDWKPQHFSQLSRARSLRASCSHARAGRATAGPASKRQCASPDRLAGRSARDCLHRSLRQCYERAESGDAAARCAAGRRRSTVPARGDLQRSASGHGLLVRDFNGLAEIAVNQGRADRELNLAIGSPVEIVS